MEIPGIDAGIRAIKAVEGSWSLPELPPMVSLDIAAFSGLEPLGIQNLLSGLDSDVSNPVATPQDTRRTYTTGEQLQRYKSGIGNFRLPREVDAGAVQSFKDRAVRLGYVEPQTLTPGSGWDPALNNLYYEMGSDDFNRAKQGNVPGPGSSISEVMETFDKWMSTTGLLEAATELGLFWNFDQIGSEIENYGNPLKHVGDALSDVKKGNPLDAFKSLWKTLGPVDDLVMPILNVGLLFSGVGQVALFGRAMKGGLVGAKALQAVHGAKYAPLTRINPKLGRMAMESTNLGADVARMQQGGALAGRILPNADVLAASGRSVGAARMAVGKGMQAWRKIPEVMIAKKVAQKGMQLGLVSRTEQAFGYEAGASVSDIPGVESATQFMRGYGEPTKFSLPSSIVFEAMFTPTTVINPGVIGNPFRHLASFKKVASHAFYSEEMSMAVQTHVGKKIDDISLTPEKQAEAQATAVAEWTTEVRTVGASQALANRFTGGNLDQLGGWMTWMAVTAAIDAQAAMVSKIFKGAQKADPFLDDAARYNEQFHTARNSLITQLRYADPDDMKTSLRAIAAADPRVTSVEDADALYKIYLQDFLYEGMPNPALGMPTSSPLNPRYKGEELLKMIDAHNVARRSQIQELLDTHMKPGIFQLAVTDKLDTIGDWNSFNKSSDLVEEVFNRGELNRATSKMGVNPETGRLIGKKETFRRQKTGPKLKAFNRFGRGVDQPGITEADLVHPITYMDTPGRQAAAEASGLTPRVTGEDFGTPLNQETFGEGSWKGRRKGSVYHGTSSRDLQQFIDPETGELVIKGGIPRATPDATEASVSFSQNPEIAFNEYTNPRGGGGSTGEARGYVFEVDIDALPAGRNTPIGVENDLNNMEVPVFFGADVVNPEVRIPKDKFRVIDTGTDPNAPFREPDGFDLGAGDISDFVPKEQVPIPRRPQIEDPAHLDLRDVVEDPEFLNLVENKSFNMFGGTNNVRGKFTIARKETISANDKRAELSAIRTLIMLKDTAGQLTTNTKLAAKWRQLLVRLENDFGVSTKDFANIKTAELNAVMKDLTYTEDEARRVRRLRRYAIKNQVDVTELEAHFDARLKKIYASERWASVHGISSDLSSDKKIKALDKQARFTAQEVDPDSMPEGLAAKLDEAGYKLVHGEEFVTPRDLNDELKEAGSGFVEINDIVHMDKYQDSLGFVGRKWHAQMARTEARVLRAAKRIGTAGERYSQEQVTMMYNSQLRNSLVKNLYSADGSHDFSKTDSIDIDYLLANLRDIASNISKKFEGNLSGATNKAQKGLANISSSFSPENPADLVRTNKLTKLMITGESETTARNGFKGLKDYEYTDDEIIKIIDGLKGARDVGPNVRGKLVSMQDRLQANPNLTDAMRFLSKTRIVDQGAGLIRSNYQQGAQMVTKAVTQAIPGAAIGVAAASQQEDMSKMRSALHLIGFGLVGRTAASTKLGFKVQKGMLKAMPYTGVGGKNPTAQVLKTNVGGRGLANVAKKLDNNQKWKHYTYTADALSTMRDYMRFTLSPIFDASRYTEGMVLSQIGDLPESVTQAGGLRFNISPTRWRKDRARVISGSKKVTTEATEQAAREWDEVRKEFAAIGKARSDFDYDALEATTARFRQIGVLGFNTQEWMASLYADLTRIHKMDQFKAYETAKKAFTYGLNPRSAVEMNANAVFFPFSFTKKTFGHAANYLGNDWSRAAMLHDAVKTYEFLNEEYNLTDIFRERLPMLEKLQRLNVFAYGLTPGELGGANRPFMNTFNKSGLDEVTINPILNLFLPQGHRILNDAEAGEAYETLSRVAPLFNDMEHLMQSSVEQGHVMFGGSGLTEAAEAERGYGEVSELNDLIDAAIKAEGGKGGISEIRRSRWSRYFKMQQAGKQAIREMYPAYQEAIAKSIGNSVLKNQAANELVAQFEAFGSDPTNGSREVKMGGLIALSEKLIRKAGSYDEISPDERDAFRELAASWAEDEQYLRLGWRTHLMRTWGPIESVLG